MRLTILSLTFASLLFGQAKICITTPDGEQCREISAAAWDSAGQKAVASCKEIAAVTEPVPAVIEPAVTKLGEKGETTVVTPEKIVSPATNREITPARTECQYADAADLMFAHLAGYARDLASEYPPESIKPLKKAVEDAQKVLSDEQAKPMLAVSATPVILRAPARKKD
jgi:hypothetical protein